MPYFSIADTFHTHSESKTLVFLRIESSHLQHVRVNHAGAENFDPACFFADGAHFVRRT